MGVVRIMLVGLVVMLHWVMGRVGRIVAHLRVGCRRIWVTTMIIKRRWRTIQRRRRPVCSWRGRELVVAGVITNLRILRSSRARIYFHVVKWRVLEFTLIGLHRRGQWKLFVNFVEVGLSFRVREQLSLIRHHPFHHSYQMRTTS